MSHMSVLFSSECTGWNSFQWYTESESENSKLSHKDKSELNLSFKHSWECCICCSGKHYAFSSLCSWMLIHMMDERSTASQTQWLCISARTMNSRLWWTNALHKPRALRYAKNTHSFNMKNTSDMRKSRHLLPESGEGEAVPSVCHGCVWLLGKWRHALNWPDWLTDEWMNCGYCGQLKDTFKLILDVTFGFYHGLIKTIY